MRCRAVALLLTTTLCSAALAQTVYRCGPDGRSYSQQPCPEGRSIAAGDPRSREQQTDTTAAVKRDARAAAALEKQRLRSERLAVAKPASLGAAKAPQPAPQKVKPKPKRKPADAAGDFRAVEPLKPRPADGR